MKPYLSIPVQLCSNAIKCGFVSQFKLFIYLKISTSGHFLCTNELKNKTCSIVGFKSVKTFNKHLEWLLVNKWITFNSKSGSFRVVGFAQLARRFKIVSSKSVVFSIDDFNTFKGFVSGAVITYMMINKSRRKRRPERLRGRSSSSRRLTLFNLPHVYLSKVLAITTSKAQRLRQDAVDAKYIKAVKHFESTNIEKAEANLYRKYSDQKNLRLIDGKIVIQKPDILSSIMTIYNKRNLRFVYSYNGKS